MNKCQRVWFALPLTSIAVAGFASMLGDVDYVHAKRINDSDPDYRYSEQFRQRVGLNASSIHIPVEIYEGDIDIQNGLAWTNKLYDIWKKNKEEDPELLWQYFGSQTGILRVYPASKWNMSSVDLYDVRRRPWYTQGASSPKNMFILIDTSGSTHGQALTLIKHSVKSLLDTLGENDFVNVAKFSDKASFVGCFDRFVQANYRNKQVLMDKVFKLTAKGMASYAKGFEFAFEQFKEFEQNKTEENEDRGEGANCNPIIMFLTDGGTEMPEKVFQKYNWPNKRIRVFSYAVGPIANPLAAVKWIACANRGYFYKIPSMGAIRSTVQRHVGIVARALAMSGTHWFRWSSIYRAQQRYQKLLGSGLVGGQSKEFLWTNIYEDFWDWPILHKPKSSNSPFEIPFVDADPTPVKGLGMMTSVTLPVYNTSQDVANQTILGVMGSDMTVSDMEAFTPYRKVSNLPWQ
ncbi:Voltage-dependent calcium channel subunit alpha-2/delta-1 [Lamellibrachia satsuma]|nr:Voltage-dependent calcium channel subunit alpha-2/delta-1 [Lamellibrachia satsuma]